MTSPTRDEARERLAAALVLLPGVKSRIKSGQQPNAYESGPGYVVGIGPVTNCLSLATTTHEGVADLLEQALRLALLSPDAGGDQPRPSVSEDRTMTPLERELFDHAWNLVMAIRGGGTLPHVSPEDRANEAAVTLNYWLDLRNATTDKGGE